MRLFGTDGVRGHFGQAPIDRTTVTSLAAALGKSLLQNHPGASSQPIVVVGGDTRESTPTLFRWLRDGLEPVGSSVRWAGVIPTPGVAVATRKIGADCGISLSASHNPFCDNGIKLFDSEGWKWSSEAETRLEGGLQAGPVEEIRAAPTVDESLVGVYLDDLAASLESACGAAPLRGLSIALDCANGAASPWARSLFERLGARVHSFSDRPDGRNINNNCGSTHPEEIARHVVETRSDVGFAFDGDADRLIAADETGRVLDGDELLYVWALHLQERGELRPEKIVATQMSNLGLTQSLAARGIEVARCDVGDRAVVNEMRRQSIVLGGEQSGHFVNLALSTTGDGMLSAIHLARLALDGGLAARTAGFHRFPQVQLNVQVQEKPDLRTLPEIDSVAKAVEAELGESGRLLLRYSGTEPLARVMIEGPDDVSIHRLATRLAQAIRAEIGA